MSFLLSRVLLCFGSEIDNLITDISAATFASDGSLWVGSDELIGIECLSPVGAHIFGNHKRFLLQDFIDLHNTEDEIDIEGMDYSEGYLWLIGSHSTKRKKAKGKSLEKDLKRLATVTTDVNRFILARIPVINGELVKSYSPADEPEQKFTAACLQKTDNYNLLIDILKKDEHLEPFITAGIPSKDNGFDIEGLAVHGNKIFIGLRGPVLRGWAIILEIEVEETEPGVLTLKEIGQAGKQYKKHFVNLNGLGIRELCLKNEELIILAGPTMELEGQMQVFRWKNPFNRPGDSMSGNSDELEVLFDLPFIPGSDHAEGLALYSCLGQNDALMVVYDAPDRSRIPKPNEVFADVFRLS